MESRDILLEPIMSEKSVQGMEEQHYSFIVHPSANKIQIRKAVEQLFKVHVVSVRTQNYEGKPKRLGRFEGKRPDFKKAIVTIKTGENIPMFEGV